MDKKMAPVAVFVYNRADHAKKTIHALNNAIGADKTDVFIFSDGAKGEKDKWAVEQTREFLRQFSKENSFRSLKIIEREKNMGLAASIITGVSDIINRYGHIIVIEDDLVAQKGLLNFLNGALAYYQQDRKIWSVSGFTIELETLKNYPQDVYFGYRGSSYAWATWKNRWNLCDWDIKDYNKFKYNPFKRARFNRGGADMSGMLDGQMAGLIDSWAIRWNYNQYKQGMYTIFASRALVQCIGYDGTGTHCGNKSFTIQQRLWEKESDFKYQPCTVDKNIKKEFWRYFSGKSLFAVNCKIRSLLFLLFRLSIYKDGRKIRIEKIVPKRS